MDLICKVVWNNQHSKSGLGNGGFITSSWSCSNLFAFTTERKKNGFLKKYFHILNPNQPWEIHSGECKLGDAVCLEWDHTGSRLLVADASGMCIVYAMNTYLTNSWSTKQELGIEMKGEEIVKAAWLHNGLKYTFYPDKFDGNAMKVEDKLKRDVFRPSLVQQGGQPVDGYIVITACGHIVANIIQPDLTVHKLSETLDLEHNILLADIAFSSDGNIIIMTTDGNTINAINFWTVKISYNNVTGRLKMDADLMPNLTLKSSTNPRYPTITHAKFVNHEQSNHVLICVSGQNGAMFESWLFKKVPSQVHKVLGNTGMSNLVDSQRWQFVTMSSELPEVVSFSIPRLPISTSSSDTKAAMDNHFYCGFGMAVALADNQIKILHRCTLDELMHHTISDTGTSMGSMPSNNVFESRKRPNSSLKTSTSIVSHVKFSGTSCALIALDNEGSLLLYRVSPWLTNAQGIVGTPKELKHLSHLLHYCLITAYDWWDVLLHMNRQSLPDGICTQLNHEFQGYSTALQQLLHSRLQAMNITIYQSGWHPKATDCHIRLLANTIAVVFRSVLKTSDSVMSNDIESDEKLIEISSTSPETDITKLIQVIDNPLPSMQPLIQWVVDICLYLLANLPHFVLQNNPIMQAPGYFLLMDKVWLATLREMLIIIKTWCLINSKCSPVFVCFDDDLDPISHIFMLITNTWTETSTTKKNVHFSNELLDKCRLLPKLIFIPNLDIILPNNGIIARINDNINNNRNFTFEKKPQKLNFYKKFSQFQYIATPEETGAVDNLRRLYLGKSPVYRLKQCMRCGILTALSYSQADPTIKIWNERFTRTCLCGGRWKSRADCI